MNQRPSCITGIKRTARKNHKCSECNNVIFDKCSYFYISGIWDGTPDSFKQCDKCKKLMDLITSNLSLLNIDFDEGPALGCLYDWVSQFDNDDIAILINSPQTGKAGKGANRQGNEACR